MLLFLGAMFIAVFGAGLLVGWWLGFTAPIDPRREIDHLARQDRRRVRSW